MMSSPAAWVEGPISYEDAKQLIAHPDAAVRAGLSLRSDVQPEILYYLAEDPVASLTPRQREISPG